MAEETWDWVDGAKATGQGAAEGYAEGGMVGGMLGGFKAYIGYASDHPGTGSLWTSQGPEARTDLDQAAALGVLRAEWGTVGGMGWSHAEGEGRQHNGQPVAFRLTYADAGPFKTSPLIKMTEAERSRAGVVLLPGVQAQGYLAAGMLIRERDENPELALLSLESEGAWGPAEVQMIQTTPEQGIRDLFSMGYVGQLPAETMFVLMTVYWGSNGSPDVYQAPRSVLQKVGLLRKDVPVVVFWKKGKRDYRGGKTAPWTYGVQLIPAGNAPTYAPYDGGAVAGDGGAVAGARRGIGAAGWLGVAGLAVPLIAAVIKR